MKNTKEQNKSKNMLINWPFMMVLVIIIIIFIVNLFAFVGKMNDTVKNREIVEQRINETNKNIEKLKYDIEKLKSDSGIEENIRENFGLVKEGEGVVVIVDDKKNVVPKPKESFWRKILSWFK